MKNVKLIASDMDHTLLMENGKLPDGFFDYIDRLDEKGIRFVVASGRPTTAMYRPTMIIHTV